MSEKQKYVSAGATISACGAYRYSLWREWRERNEAILRDANAKVCLSREAFDAVHQADLFQPPVPK